MYLYSSTKYPYPPHAGKINGNSEGVGLSKAQIFEVKYEAKLDFQRDGGEWGTNQNTFYGDMNIFCSDKLPK